MEWASHHNIRRVIYWISTREAGLTSYQVLISVEQAAQAYRILDALMEQRLITGGPVVGGPAKFLWNFALTNAGVEEGLSTAGVVTVEQDCHLIVTHARTGFERAQYGSCIAREDLHG